MDTNFDKELIKEINQFRTNPKIIKIYLEKEIKTFNLKKTKGNCFKRN